MLISVVKAGARWAGGQRVPTAPPCCALTQHIRYIIMDNFYFSILAIKYYIRKCRLNFRMRKLEYLFIFGTLMVHNRIYFLHFGKPSVHICDENSNNDIEFILFSL